MVKECIFNKIKKIYTKTEDATGKMGKTQNTTANMRGTTRGGSERTREESFN